MIPKNAYRVKFRNRGLLQSGHYLCFCLPPIEAKEPAEYLRNRYRRSKEAAGEFPIPAKVRDGSETIWWSEFNQNHGHQKGIWYYPQQNQFTYFSDSW
jgi:hypothetical protein